MHFQFPLKELTTMLAVHILFGAKQVVDAFDHQLASCKRHAGFGSYYIKKFDLMQTIKHLVF